LRVAAAPLSRGEEGQEASPLVLDAATRWAAWASEASTSKDGSLLQLLFQKLALWGRFLTAQFIASGSFAISDMNAMQMESVGLRQQVAWSVPTEEALGMIGKYAPLVELGAGTGLWAQLLSDRGVDIVSFDLPEWDSKYGEKSSDTGSLQGQTRNNIIRTGGPEELVQHPERTLLLMWPDYQGMGGFGLECLQMYTGTTLVLAGEWQDNTFGLVQPWGQSFSKDFQEVVEAEFERVCVLSLPCWPLFSDVLMVWKRRGCSNPE